MTARVDRRRHSSSEGISLARAITPADEGAVRAERTGCRQGDAEQGLVSVHLQGANVAGDWTWDYGEAREWPMASTEAVGYRRRGRRGRHGRRGHRIIAVFSDAARQCLVSTQIQLP